MTTPILHSRVAHVAGSIRVRVRVAHVAGIVDV